MKDRKIQGTIEDRKDYCDQIYVTVRDNEGIEYGLMLNNLSPLFEFQNRRAFRCWREGSNIIICYTEAEA